MAKSASIQKMSTRHEAILQFMIANPTLKMSQIAAHFCVTPAWLSTIVHSDAFQDQLARRHDELFDVAVVQELGDKLTAAAHMTIEEYIDKVPTLSPDQLISASDKLLGRLGYGSKNVGSVTNFNLGDNASVQVNQVTGDVLAKAREKIGSSNGAAKVCATDSPPALQDQSAAGSPEAEGDSLRTSCKPGSGGEVRAQFIYPESVVQVSTLRGQDKILPD